MLHRVAATLFMLLLVLPPATGQVNTGPTRVFISGHSLTDLPMPTYFARISESLGQRIQWNRQYIEGSPIRSRTRGRQRETGWIGYSHGLNREGEGMNVLHEFRSPRTTDGAPYDTLIITEQHGVLDSIVTHDTVRHLRHYHERFIEGNPRGQTWFFEPWLGMVEKSDPTRWIAYEQAAAPLWQCAVTRVNLSLAAEGRLDRIRALPASLSLATLVDRAARGKVNGLDSKERRRMMDRLFLDQVHLTPLGAYYMALSVYAATSGRSPVGAWAPHGIDSSLALALQKTAWEAVSAEQATRKLLPLDQCAPYMAAFEATYFAHMRDYHWAQQGDSIRLDYRRWRNRLQWKWRLWTEFDNDPFRYEAETDKAHWLPAP